MKTLALEKTTLAVRKAAYLAKGDVLILTENGKPAFAIVGVKDAMALEALALGRNDDFMAYLDGVSAEARGKKRYSLQEIQDELGLEAPKPAPAPKKRVRRR